MNHLASHHVDLIVYISAYIKASHFINAVLRLSKAANSSLSHSSTIFRAIAASVSCPICIIEYDACSSLYQGNEVYFWKISARSATALTKIRRQQGCIVAQQVFICEHISDEREDNESEKVNLLWPLPNDLPSTEVETKSHMMYNSSCLTSMLKRLFGRIKVLRGNNNVTANTIVRCPSIGYSRSLLMHNRISQSEVEDLLDRFLRFSSGVLLAKERVCNHQHCVDEIASMVYSFQSCPSATQMYVQVSDMQRLGRVGGWTEVCIATRNEGHMHNELPLIAPYSKRKMFRKSDMLMLVRDLYDAVGGNTIASSKVRWFVCNICSIDSDVGPHSSDIREILVAICFHYPLSTLKSEFSVERGDQLLEAKPLSARIAGICKVSKDFNWI